VDTKLVVLAVGLAQIMLVHATPKLDLAVGIAVAALKVALA
jgi:hypothetical protein